MFQGLTNAQRRKLETGVVSNRARLQLTRFLRTHCHSESRDPEGDATLIQMNQAINLARAVLGLPIHRLDPDDWGFYPNVEYAWHNAELELVMRRPSTADLIETLGDLLGAGRLDMDEVNEVLKQDNVGIEFEYADRNQTTVVVDIAELGIADDDAKEDHPNIRLLVERMENSFTQEDYASVLHSSATIFETLGKIVFNDSSVEHESLLSFFEGYRKRSLLPEPLLEYIKQTYTRRNTEPLAGHGATKPPSVSPQEAAILVEMTKLCVRLERRLAEVELKVERPPRKEE